MVVPMILPRGELNGTHSDEAISTNDYGGEEAGLCPVRERIREEALGHLGTGTNAFSHT
jgi:hypothetical protein